MKKRTLKKIRITILAGLYILAVIFMPLTTKTELLPKIAGYACVLLVQLVTIASWDRRYTTESQAFALIYATAWEILGAFV